MGHVPRRQPLRPARSTTPTMPRRRADRRCPAPIRSCTSLSARSSAIALPARRPRRSATRRVRVLVTVGPAGDPAALGPQPGHVRVERYVPQTRFSESAPRSFRTPVRALSSPPWPRAPAALSSPGRRPVPECGRVPAIGCRARAVRTSLGAGDRRGPRSPAFRATFPGPGRAVRTEIAAMPGSGEVVPSAGGAREPVLTRGRGFILVGFVADAPPCCVDMSVVSRLAGCRECGHLGPPRYARRSAARNSHPGASGCAIAGSKMSDRSGNDPKHLGLIDVKVRSTDIAKTRKCLDTPGRR